MERGSAAEVKVPVLWCGIWVVEESGSHGLPRGGVVTVGLAVLGAESWSPDFRRYMAFQKRKLPSFATNAYGSALREESGMWPSLWNLQCWADGNFYRGRRELSLAIIPSAFFPWYIAGRVKYSRRKLTLFGWSGKEWETRLFSL